MSKRLLTILIILRIYISGNGHVLIMHDQANDVKLLKHFVEMQPQIMVKYVIELIYERVVQHKHVMHVCVKIYNILVNVVKETKNFYILFHQMMQHSKQHQHDFVHKTS